MNNNKTIYLRAFTTNEYMYLSELLEQQRHTDRFGKEELKKLRKKFKDGNVL